LTRQQACFGCASFHLNKECTCTLIAFPKNGRKDAHAGSLAQPSRNNDIGGQTRHYFLPASNIIFLSFKNRLF
jgi:hypothetical protein